MRREDREQLKALIRGHPDFAEGLQRYIVELIAWREGLGVLNRVIGNVARLRILENMIYLHYAEPLAQGGHGATFERLAHLSQTYDGIGVRAVRTALRLAQMAGFVTSARDPHDGRLRVFRPTATLVGQARQFLTFSLRPLDRVFPEHRISERLEHDPQFYLSLVAAFGSTYLEREIRWTQPGTPYHQLIRLEGAIPIVAVVVDCFWNRRALPPAAELSRRFVMSESQARAVLKTAVASGLIRMGPRGALLDAEPLAQALIDSRARVLAFGARCIFNVVAQAGEN